MKKALIVSLKFNPGHASHLVASYNQCEELGYNSTYYVASNFLNFLPKDSRYILYGDNLPTDFDLAIFLFPSQKILPTIWKLRRNKNCKVLYIFHEPVLTFDEFAEAGYTKIQVFLERLKDYVGCLIERSADAVLLPSKKAYNNFKNCSRYRNENFHYVPLLFDDENKDSSKVTRKYFSYIGTIASDHSYNEYVKYVLWAINNNELQGVDFLIATKSGVERTEEINKAISCGRLSVCDGKPMTNEEINHHYAASYMVWNAYERMMQSGVLPKAFMFGTPALVLRKNESEFVKDGEGVVAIDDNSSTKEITNAVTKVVDSFESYSKKCRDLFFRDFYYRTHNQLLKNIIDKI